MGAVEGVFDGNDCGGWELMVGEDLVFVCIVGA